LFSTVDHTTFNAGDTAIISKQKSRLRGLRGFPSSLAALIQPAGRYTQKLNLPLQQIRQVQLAASEREAAQTTQPSARDWRQSIGFSHVIHVASNLSEPLSPLVFLHT
jgi:hypothetical protein